MAWGFPAGAPTPGLRDSGPHRPPRGSTPPLPTGLGESQGPSLQARDSTLAPSAAECLPPRTQSTVCLLTQQPLGLRETHTRASPPAPRRHARGPCSLPLRKPWSPRVMGEAPPSPGGTFRTSASAAHCSSPGPADGWSSARLLLAPGGTEAPFLPLLKGPG